MYEGIEEKLEYIIHRIDEILIDYAYLKKDNEKAFAKLEIYKTKMTTKLKFKQTRRKTYEEYFKNHCNIKHSTAESTTVSQEIRTQTSEKTDGAFSSNASITTKWKSTSDPATTVSKTFVPPAPSITEKESTKITTGSFVENTTNPKISTSKLSTEIPTKADTTIMKITAKTSRTSASKSTLNGKITTRLIVTSDRSTNLTKTYVPSTKAINEQQSTKSTTGSFVINSSTSKISTSKVSTKSPTKATTMGMQIIENTFEASTINSTSNAAITNKLETLNNTKEP